MLNSNLKHKKIHLMGICGTAMASLAGILQEMGARVTGSDQNPYPPMSTQLASLGIEVMKGYCPENLAHLPDLVIVGNVISRGNPEVEELLKLGIEYTSLPKALGAWILKDRHSIVVAGTHGKTTTTSLTSWLCDQVGEHPGFLIGGIPKNFSYSFRTGGPKYFVIEGDEYDTAFFDKVPKFVHYHSKSVILTSIEFDHADIYKDLNAVKSAFSTLFRTLSTAGQGSGLLMYYGGDANIRDILTDFLTIDSVSSPQEGFRKVSYGLQGCDYNAKVLSQDSQGTRFSVTTGRGDFSIELILPMVGTFNVLNATASFALGRELGWPMEKMQAAMKKFQGVKRRQEIIGEPGGITIIEDFAHHPTAVKETIHAIQERYQGRKVFSIFEPRSATSRRKVFQKDYMAAFSLAQEVLLAEPYDQSKIQEEDRFSVTELSEDLKKKGVLSQVFLTAEAIVSYLQNHAKKTDVILIMSNGGFDGIYQKLLATLK